MLIMALVVAAPPQLYQLPLALISTTCKIPPHRLPIINNPSNNPTNEPSSAPANAPASAPSSRSNNTKFATDTNTAIAGSTPSESSFTDSVATISSIVFFVFSRRNDEDE